MSELKKRLYKKLDIEPEVFSGSMVEIFGQESVMVRGCRKILVYTLDEIKLSLGKSILSVRGEGLVCTSYYSRSVGIEGKIYSVTFEEVKK